MTPVAPAGAVCPPAGRAASEGDDASTIQNAVHAMLEWDCVRCEEPTTIAKSQPVNKEKPFDKRKFNLCSSTDRILQRRKLMDNFKKKEPSEKKAYYLERKHSSDPNAVINALVTSQREDEYNKREVTENDNYVPFSLWKRNRIAEDLAKASRSDKDWKDEWDRILEDEEQDNKMYIRGQWCIGEFAGVTVTSTAGKSFTGTVQRKSDELHDADELEAASKANAEALRKWKKHAGPIVPQIKPAMPTPHTPYMGEVTPDIGGTRWIAGLQHELALEAATAELDGAAFAPKNRTTPEKNKKERSAVVLELNWDALVSKHVAAVISSLTTRRERMEEVSLSCAAEEPMTQAHKEQLHEVIQKCRKLYGELKDEADKMLEEWKGLTSPVTEEAYKEDKKN